MPILAFEIIEPNRIKVDDTDIMNDEPIQDGTLACLEVEFYILAFQFFEEKLCKGVQIAILNNACVFDFTMDGCLINVISKETEIGQFVGRNISKIKYRCTEKIDRIYGNIKRSKIKILP